MWISKKKFNHALHEEYLKALRQFSEWDATEEIQQDKRIRDLEKQVKKLKKWVKNGY